MNNTNFTYSLAKQPIVFRKFSRKRYAVFNSMHKLIKIATLGVAYSLIVSPAIAICQSDTLPVSKIIEVDEVEIIGQKSASLFDEMPRVVALINKTDIKQAPSQHIDDLLRYTGSIDVKQRGKGGAQADIAIRGGSFDQSLILLNGINISDPQTGHLSFFLPLDLDALTKIEVLNGPAARVYGANAFSGAVNFVTQPLDFNSLRLSASIGQYGGYNTSATVNLATQKYKQLLSISASGSDGEYINTDFKRKNFFYQGQLNTAEGVFGIELGYADRSFGANSFYSPKYPDQFENNKMTFGAVSYKTGKNIKFQSKIYWRRHRDRFELFREDKDWYTLTDSATYSNNFALTQYDTVTWYNSHNHHINDVYGAKADVFFKSILGKTSFGFELRNESIISNVIGYETKTPIPVRGYSGIYYNKNDNRSNFNLYGEHIFTTGPITLTLGALANWNSFQADELNFFPGIDMRLKIVTGFDVIGSYNYTLGLPTFTDLTYHDPNNVGSVDLKPYTQNSFEGGLRYYKNWFQATAVYFHTSGKEVIDWVWYTDLLKYRPVNTDKTTIDGLEMSFNCDFTKVFDPNFIVQSFRINYSFNDVVKTIENAESTPENILKYYNPRNMVSAMLRLQPIKNLNLNFNYSLMEREGSYLTYDFTAAEYVVHDFEKYQLVDTRVAYSFKAFTAYVEVNNLLDVNYVDVGSIYQPGRSFIAGLVFELNNF